ncbi:MAG: hypothetical protein WBE08_11980 [Methyloceanibacter sp.]
MPNPSDPSTAVALPKIDWGLWEVLIAITSISVGLFALLISFFALVFYFLGRKWAADRIAAEVKAQLKASELELRGRLVGYVGYIFGRLSEIRPDFIHPAINHSRLAFGLLSDTSEWKLVAANNLAFYYSKRKYETDGAAAKEYAETLLADYAKSHDVDWLTTYAAVVGAYSAHFENPKRALSDAEKMMEELQTREDVTIDQKQSAARHLETIRAALKTLG